MAWQDLEVGCMTLFAVARLKQKQASLDKFVSLSDCAALYCIFVCKLGELVYLDTIQWGFL